MQPIIMLAVVGVAAVALGTGFLNNNIELWIQEFGVGAGDIESPVDHVTVDFNIEQRIKTPVTNPPTYKNIIDKCEFTVTEFVGDITAVTGDPVSKMTCKITGHDENWQASGQIIAEGTLCALNFPPGNYMIPLGAATAIDPLNDPCPPSVAVLGPTTVDVRDAGDVIVVVQSNTYSAGEHSD